MWENGFPNHVPPLSFWTVIFGLAWITVIAFQPESLCKVIFLKHFSHSSRDQKQSYSSLSAKHLQASFYREVARAKFPLNCLKSEHFQCFAVLFVHLVICMPWALAAILICFCLQSIWCPPKEMQVILINLTAEDVGKNISIVL